MKKFFVSCNIGFEDELEKELNEIWPFLLGLDGKPHSEPLNLLEKDRGGILIENSFHLGLQINYLSKLANRVLLRVSEFRVRDFPKLFAKLKSLEKEPLLQGFEQGLRFEVAASQSRLNNEKRILEILRELFKENSSEDAQALFVRMHDDLCSVSLDTSGEHLHKRSERWKAGEAPLRETLAAFCGRQLLDGLHFSELKEATLIDPMAGTGTMLLETSLLYQASPRDDFPFLQWKTTPKIFKSPSFVKNYSHFPKVFGSVLAGDRDEKVLALCESRLQSAQLNFKVECQDLMRIDGLVPSDVKKIRPFLLLNPPYGERLSADFSASELLAQLTKVFNPARIGVLFSENQVKSVIKDLKTSGKLPEVKTLQLRSESHFKNGGIPVVFLVFS